ncbi:MAG: glucose PTS transporter subunit EIIB, partial [Plesiomonas sp.]
ALTCFLTGITEPLEFSFLFLAPVLYVVHAFFDGLAFMLAHIFSITIGQTFSGGFIDFVLFGILQGETKTNWMFVPVIGTVWFFLYYFTFRILITKLGLNTPGREKEAVEAEPAGEAISGTERAQRIIDGLGGKSNIKDVDCCATRLRISVNDSEKVNQELIKSTQSRAIVMKGNGVQIIYGPHVTIIKNEIEEVLGL